MMTPSYSLTEREQIVVSRHDHARTAFDGRSEHDIVGRISANSSDAACVLDQVGDGDYVGEPAKRLVRFPEIPPNLPHGKRRLDLLNDCRQKDAVEHLRGRALTTCPGGPLGPMGALTSTLASSRARTKVCFFGDRLGFDLPRGFEPATLGVP